MYSWLTQPVLYFVYPSDSLQLKKEREEAIKKEQESREAQNKTVVKETGMATRVYKQGVGKYINPGVQ